MIPEKNTQHDRCLWGIQYLPNTGAQATAVWSPIMNDLELLLSCGRHCPDSDVNNLPIT